MPPAEIDPVSLEGEDEIFSGWHLIPHFFVGPDAGTIVIEVDGSVLGQFIAGWPSGSGVCPHRIEVGFEADLFRCPSITRRGELQYWSRGGDVDCCGSVGLLGALSVHECPDPPSDENEYDESDEPGPREVVGFRWSPTSSNDYGDGNDDNCDGDSEGSTH